MYLVLLGIAILPIILFGFYVYIKDKNKEPTSLLIRLFLGGFLSVLTTLLIDRALENISFFTLEVKSLDLISLLIYVFLKVALVEEFSKWLYSYLIGFKSKEFDESYDSIIYCAFVSLGFACLENILYIFGDLSIKTGILRAVTAIPGHLCDAIIMGYFLSLAKQHEDNKTKYILLSIFVPSITHCIYDYLLYTGLDVMVLIFFAFIICLFGVCYNIIKKQSKENKRIGKSFCIHCGSEVNGNNFCSKCGEKV